MAIATSTAILAGSALAAGGAALSARSQSKAASKAADTATQTADKNNALTREIYGQNKQMLDPYVQRGNVAGGALNDFYGLTQPTQPMQQPNAMTQFQGYNPDSTGGAFGTAQGFDISPEPGFQGGNGIPGQFTMPGTVTGFGSGTFNPDGTQVTVGTQGQPAPQSNAGDPFRRYIENSDYAFRFGEGANDINSGYAGAGMLQSGAAMKDLERFRQNLQSGYRNEWAGGVANQQGVGLAGASALAGVGQNYVNTISQNNNNAGSAAANAALMRGQNNPLAAGLGAAGGAYIGLFGGKK